MDPLCLNWSRCTNVLGMLTRNRRCLRVTTDVFAPYASGSSIRKRLQITNKPLALRFLHTKEFDAEFIF